MAGALNFVDRIIGYFSPRAACSRVYYREALRSYDAGRLDRYGDWMPPRNATPEETDAPHRSLIRGRARDLERNNDVTLGLIGSLQRNVIGSGIHPQSLVPAYKGQIAELWNDWVKKTDCDITGCSTFYELQKMFLGRRYVDGEIFCLFAVRGKSRVPLQLQMIESDLLAEEVIKYESGVNRVHGGVEVDDYMRPVAYHFRLDPLTWEVTRVPADRVLHSFAKSRPQQVRGISRLSASMERIRDIGEYIDSELKAARIAASQTGVVKSAKGAASSIMRTKKGPGGKEIQEIFPGTMNYLQPDEDILFPPPGRPNANAAGFAAAIMQFVGIASGLSYEQVARDMSKVNYSSARQGYLEDQRTYKEWQDDVVNNFCQPVYEVFLDTAVLNGALIIPDYWQNRKRYIRARWITPGWSWIDPQKEAAASAQLLDTGLTTREELCGNRGKEWREVMAQLKEEQDYADAIGLKLGVSGMSGTGEEEVYAKGEETPNAGEADDEG